VIVSDVGGLAEIVENWVSGSVMQPSNPEKIVKVEVLLFDKDLEMKIGKAGRTRAKRLYNLKDTVNKMTPIYENMLRWV
jgi:glycosyltransferase involved in cell wall biosynthesis